MIFIHLGDLHIGKRVHERSMLDDQRHVIGQILDVAREQQVDAVLIAGDVFDKSTPSREALELAEELFAGLIKLGIAVYMVPGNHDCAQQVSYCSSITEAVGLHVAKAYDGAIARYRVEDAFGPIDIHLLPFVRPMDVRLALDKSTEEVATYQDAVRTALEAHQIDTSVRNILVAHQFVVNGESRPETCDSEMVSVGGIDSVQADLFDAFDYVALGHIHGDQHVRRSEVRYCGTPLKYSFSEVAHNKSISVVEIGAANGAATNAEEQAGASLAPVTIESAPNLAPVTIERIPVFPLHEMREIKASFEELQSGCDCGNHEDYMHITLTDESVFDALNRVRALYPNLLHLDWADSLNASAESHTTLEDVQQKTPEELLQDFFAEQYGQACTEDQQAVLSEIFACSEGGAQ